MTIHTTVPKSNLRIDTVAQMEDGDSGWVHRDGFYVDGERKLYVVPNAKVRELPARDTLHLRLVEGIYSVFISANIPPWRVDTYGLNGGGKHVEIIHMKGEDHDSAG